MIHRREGVIAAAALICATALFPRWAAAAQEKRSPGDAKRASGTPAVTHLRLAPAQTNVLTLFLSEHPGYRLATLGDSAGWKFLLKEQPDMGKQFPFAVFRDLNDDGRPDFGVTMINDTPLNSWGSRRKIIAVFHGTAEGTYQPGITVLTEDGAIDGMVWNAAKHWVEVFNWGVAAGGFKWNGSKYVVTPLVGD